MADCGYAEDCYLLKYLLPFTQAYRKAAKNVVGCSGQSAQKVVIPELEELPGVGYIEDEEEYHNYGDFTSDGEEEEEEEDYEHENNIEDEGESHNEGEDEEEEEEDGDHETAGYANDSKSKGY